MQEFESPKKVILAKCGMDGHDRGIVMISQWLRNEGMEVIYLGPYRTPISIAKAALQEDADMVGLSFLSGGHILHSTHVIQALKENGMDIPVFVGGIVPQVDISSLKSAGVSGVFPAGTSIKDILNDIKNIPARS